MLQPDTVLMTRRPSDDPLQAEVGVTHDDAALVGAGQPAKLTLATDPFQKYRMIDGKVKRLSPDSSHISDARGDRRTGAGEGG